MWNFDGEPGAAGRRTVLVTLIQVGCDYIVAGLQSGRVNLRGSIARSNFYPCATPTVGDSTLGIEIRANGRRGHRLAFEDFGRL